MVRQRSRTARQLFSFIDMFISLKRGFDFLFPNLKRNLIFIIGVPTVAFVAPPVAREFVTVRYYNGKENLHGKSVLITGASDGIGAFTAKALAKRGARVIMACRDLERCEKTNADILKYQKSANTVCKALDLSSFQSVVDFVADIYRNENPVDILINNAATMVAEPKMTSDELECHLQVNFLGPFLLTNLLLERMAPNARILNVNCVQNMNCDIDFGDLNFENKEYDSVKVYSQSKLALMTFANELAYRLRKSGSSVTCNSVDPGSCDTKLLKKGVEGFFNELTDFLSSFWFRNERQAAQCILFGALSPKLEYNTGLYFRNSKRAEPNPLSKDEMLRVKLWRTAEELSRLSEHKEKLNSLLDSQSLQSRPWYKIW